MLIALNHLVETVEDDVAEHVHVAAVASAHGTTEHHLRRMFSSLAGMPLSEYMRRRRMTLAAVDLVQSDDDLLTIAVRNGYGSIEAFGRAFRAVHGIGPTDARRSGGPFRSQQPIRFRLTIEGNTPMHVRITDQPAIRFVGHAVRVPLIHHGVNPHIAAHIAAIPMLEHLRLKKLSNAGPGGLLQISDEVDSHGAVGSELTYMHGVAVTVDTPVPDDLHSIPVPEGKWAIFTSEGPHPQALQETWAATASEWYPSNPWRLRPGPSFVAVLEHNEDFTTATCELWQPVEPA